jgi:hypothetical protein
LVNTLEIICIFYQLFIPEVLDPARNDNPNRTDFNFDIVVSFGLRRSRTKIHLVRNRLNYQGSSFSLIILRLVFLGFRVWSDFNFALTLLSSSSN